MRTTAEIAEAWQWPLRWFAGEAERALMEPDAAPLKMTPEEIDVVLMVSEPAGY